MKILFISVLVAVLVSAQNYAGKWSFKEDGMSFSLNLKQQDSLITGNHLSIMLNGNRIDGEFDDTETIRGFVKDGKAIVSIKSSYGGGTGKAELTLKGQDSLCFELTKRPEGECWLPNKVVLVKKENK